MAEGVQVLILASFPIQDIFLKGEGLKTEELCLIAGQARSAVALMNAESAEKRMKCINPGLKLLK